MVIGNTVSNTISSMKCIDICASCNFCKPSTGNFLWILPSMAKNQQWGGILMRKSCLAQGSNWISTKAISIEFAENSQAYSEPEQTINALGPTVYWLRMREGNNFWPVLFFNGHWKTGAGEWPSGLVLSVVFNNKTYNGRRNGSKSWTYLQHLTLVLI